MVLCWGLLISRKMGFDHGRAGNQLRGQSHIFLVTATGVQFIQNHCQCAFSSPWVFEFCKSSNWNRSCCHLSISTCVNLNFLVNFLPNCVFFEIICIYIQNTMFKLETYHFQNIQIMPSMCRPATFYSVTFQPAENPATDSQLSWPSCIQVSEGSH